VLAAAAGGPVPDDPELREAAAALVRDRIGELDRGRGLTLAVFGGAAVVSLVAAIANPWYLVVTAAGVAAMTVASADTVRALMRRFTDEVLNGRDLVLQGMFAAFPDLRWTVHDSVVEGDRIVFRVVLDRHPPRATSTSARHGTSASFSGDRASTRTSCPAASRSGTSRPPM
jgi:hypothetical protein